MSKSTSHGGSLGKSKSEKHLPNADGFRLDYRTQLGGGELREELRQPVKFRYTENDSGKLAEECRSLGIDPTGMSRQLMWQKIRMANGRCRQCGLPADGYSVCAACRNRTKEIRGGELVKKKALTVVEDTGGPLIKVRDGIGNEFYSRRDKVGDRKRR